MTSTPMPLTTCRPVPPTAPTPTRLRWADLVRAGALTIVVLGHFLMAVVVVRDGAIDVGSLLDVAPWSQPLTWLLQVMGCFFAVGAVVAGPGLAQRLVEADESGRGGWTVWRDHVVARSRSLLVPALPLLALWTLVGPLLRDHFGEALANRASQAALVPLWFLAVYLLVHALLPLAVRVVVRFGVWRPVVALLGTAAVLDAVRIAGAGGTAWVSFPVVWMAPTLVGLGVGLGLVRGRDLAVAGLAVLSVAVALVAVEAYPVALVGVTNAARSNNHPPTLLLGLHAVAFASLVLASAPRAEGWLAATPLRRRTLVVASRWSMGLYLWHLTALVGLLALALVVPVPGLTRLLAIEPLTSGWWVARPVHLAVGTAVTVLLVLVVARPTAWLVARSRSAGVPSAVRASVGVLAASFGIASVVANGTAVVSPAAILALAGAAVALHPRRA